MKAYLTLTEAMVHELLSREGSLFWEEARIAQQVFRDMIGPMGNRLLITFVRNDSCKFVTGRIRPSRGQVVVVIGDRKQVRMNWGKPLEDIQEPMIYEMTKAHLLSRVPPLKSNWKDTNAKLLTVHTCLRTLPWTNPSRPETHERQPSPRSPGA